MTYGCQCSLPHWHMPIVGFFSPYSFCLKERGQLTSSLTKQTGIHQSDYYGDEGKFLRNHYYQTIIEQFTHVQSEGNHARRFLKKKNPSRMIPNPQPYPGIPSYINQIFSKINSLIWQSVHWDSDNVTLHLHICPLFSDISFYITPYRRQKERGTQRCKHSDICWPFYLVWMYWRLLNRLMMSNDVVKNNLNKCNLDPPLSVLLTTGC